MLRSRIDARMRGLNVFGAHIASTDPDLQTAGIKIPNAITDFFRAWATVEIIAWEQTVG